MKGRLKFALRLLGAAAAVLVLGVGSALFVISTPPESLTMYNGPWRTNLATGSADLGMYMRATVTLMGLFALDRSEALYWVAETDSNGRDLRSDCDYRIEGTDPDARWWSITLYGWDTYLIPNDRDRYSYNGGNVRRTDDGGFSITVSPEPGEGDWLPSGDNHQLYLLLRLYNQSAEVQDNPGDIELPRIINGGCR